MKKVVIVLLVLLAGIAGGAVAQNQPAGAYDKKGGAASKSKVEKIRNLEKAMKGEDSQHAAEELEQLGSSYAYKKQYEQSNYYYNKALDIYRSEKNKDKQAYLLRRIAANNEALQKNSEALNNYEASKEVSNSDLVRRLNSNDISRMQNMASRKEVAPASDQVSTRSFSSNQVQSELIDEKIKMLENSPAEKEDVIQAYQQKAEIALNLKDTQTAISNLKKASEVADKEHTIAIKEDLADLYATANSLEEAIATTRSGIEKAIQLNDKERLYTLQEQLAEYYFQSGKQEQALALLNEALETAYREHNTVAVANLSGRLFRYWKERGDMKTAGRYAETFLEKVVNVINGDSVLLQNKLFDEIAQRVSLLEKEKDTQVLLYNKTKVYNLVLSILLCLTILTILGVIWVLYKLKRKNLQILLQSLRREMNPHFIFNSLNSVNQFIAENDEMAANRYLTKYATLMRNVMTTSNKDFINLNDEKTGMEHYLSLEALRFQDKFDYRLEVDDALDLYHTPVPNMLLQPFVENAIWHGLRYKDTKGLLEISIMQTGDRLTAVVKDDGIGVAASQRIKTRNQQTYKSRGIKNTQERIATLNKLYGCDITCSTDAVTEIGSGTRVIISWKKPKYDVSAQN